MDLENKLSFTHCALNEEGFELNPNVQMDPTAFHSLMGNNEQDDLNFGSSTNDLKNSSSLKHTFGLKPPPFTTNTNHTSMTGTPKAAESSNF